MKEDIKKAFLSTVPVLAGYMVLGMGFGILLQANGYSVVWAFLMSLFIYAGSMQYAAVGLITGGASLLTVAVTTLAVNARHLFYGISMVDKYKDTGKLKPYLIFALTDETYSIVCNENISDGGRRAFLISVFDHIYWVTGSVLGSLIGSVLPFSTEGIEFSLTALFLTVFTDQWIKTKNHAAAVIGVAASFICLLIFGGDNFLIPSMVLIIAALFLMRIFKKGEKSNG